MIRNNNQLTVVITVERDATGPPAAHLSYHPAVLLAHRGDCIKWKCENGPFVLQFLRGTPLGHVYIHSNGSNGNYETDCIPVPPGAPNGRHPYAVAVCSERIVHIDAGCPEIIID